jgi:hypothetical protein
MISDPDTQGFTAQSSQYKSLEDEDDLEYDILPESETQETANYPYESSSFEQSGTKSNKTWNRKGSPPTNSKKECIVS